MKKSTRGRRPVLRTLPPLAESCADFTGFAGGESNAQRIFELLASVLQRHRRATPQAFYAMREVAEFFGVALTTVARVYRRLDREGVLTLVRSSQSIVAPRAPRPRFAVRGVVCMPIWLPGFLHFLDWRKWFSRLEEELSRYHFVLEPIFYKFDEELSPAFVERVLRFNPDYVLWNWPGAADRNTMQSIADAGVPLILIQYTAQNLPGREYRTSYERGLRQGIAAWTAGGRIKQIVIPQQAPLKDENARVLKSILKGGSLPYRFQTCPQEPSPVAAYLSYLQGLAPDRRTGVIFGDDLLYVELCALAPEAMLELMRQRRVMVMRQTTIPLRIKTPRNISVDALIFPWKKLARRIAMDLGKATVATSSVPAVIEAEWRPQIPLGTVVQTTIQE